MFNKKLTSILEGNTSSLLLDLHCNFELNQGRIRALFTFICEKYQTRIAPNHITLFSV